MTCALQRAIHRAPEDARLHLALARAHVASGAGGSPDRILHHARRAIVLAPDDRAVLRPAGAILMDLGLRCNRADLWREGVRASARAFCLTPAPDARVAA